MAFDEILGQVLQLLQRQGRMSYRALKIRTQPPQHSRSSEDSHVPLILARGLRGRLSPTRRRMAAPLAQTAASAG